MTLYHWEAKYLFEYFEFCLRPLKSLTFLSILRSKASMHCEYRLVATMRSQVFTANRGSWSLLSWTNMVSDSKHELWIPHSSGRPVSILITKKRSRVWNRRRVSSSPGPDAFCWSLFRTSRTVSWIFKLNLGEASKKIRALPCLLFARACYNSASVIISSSIWKKFVRAVNALIGRSLVMTTGCLTRTTDFSPENGAW